jgi:hypothetical protein
VRGHIKGNQSVRHIDRQGSYARTIVCRAGPATLIYTFLLWLLANRQYCGALCKGYRLPGHAVATSLEGRGFDSRGIIGILINIILPTAQWSWG